MFDGRTYFKIICNKLPREDLPFEVLLTLGFPFEATPPLDCFWSATFHFPRSSLGSLLLHLSHWRFISEDWWVERETFDLDQFLCHTTRGRPACISPEVAIQGGLRKLLQFIHLFTGTSFTSKLATIQTEVQKCLKLSKMPVLHECRTSLFFFPFSHQLRHLVLSFLAWYKSPPDNWKVLNSEGVHNTISCDWQFGNNTLHWQWDTSTTRKVSAPTPSSWPQNLQMLWAER